MANRIEETEAQQRWLWRRTLSAFFLLIALLVVRYFFGTVFRAHELNTQPIGVAVLLMSIVALGVIVVGIIQLGRLQKRIAADPRLREALQENEFIQSHYLHAWKAGFIGAAVAPLLLVLLSVRDPLTIAFVAPIVGSGAFLTTLYRRNARDD